MHDAFLKLIAASLTQERFSLVDVGCSGGIDPIWRVFGDRLVALGFDASVSECRRLTEIETQAGVQYVPGFVGIPPSHPFARKSANKPLHSGDRFHRSSAVWTMELRKKQLATASDHEKMQHNLWRNTELANPAEPLFLAQELPRRGFNSVDLLKIDIDGTDHIVLNSLDGLFERLGILAARLEVCMFGGAAETDNTFHNVDRFMRRQGYDLARLDSVRYSMRALPARYAITMAAQTVSGRIAQADAFYVRDLIAPSQRALAERISVEKIAKLAAIFAAWEQPDGAAELLLHFRDRLAALFDVDKGLDMLAAQTQWAEGDKDEVEILSYSDYLAAFTTDPPDFYPPPPRRPSPKPTLRQKIGAAWLAWSDWDYAEQIEQAKRRKAMLETKRRARDARIKKD